MEIDYSKFSSAQRPFVDMILTFKSLEEFDKWIDALPIEDVLAVTMIMVELVHQGVLKAPTAKPKQFVYDDPMDNITDCSEAVHMLKEIGINT